MQKRNFILLIIVLAIILLVFFAFLFSDDSDTPVNVDPGGNNFFAQFNPFAGGGVGTQNPDRPTGTGDDEPLAPATGQTIFQVSSGPVAGYAVFMKERFKEVVPDAATAEESEVAPTQAKPTPPATEFVPALRYVDRVSGNIFQTFADKIDERKFSTTEIPKVYEAFFGNNALTVIMRYIKSDGKTIETLLANLPKEVLGGDIAGDIELRGVPLTADIKDMNISPDGGNAFYLFDSGETTIGTVLEFATGKKAQVFDSSYNEWLSQWPSGKLVTLTTKPSFVSPGYMYRLDTGTKSFSQVLGGITGLTTLTSPDGKKVIYSDNNLALSLYHMDTKIAVSLGLRGLPEKCVWAKDSVVLYCMAPKAVIGANYPDSWYQGEISFDDQLWSLNTDTGTATSLLDPANADGGEAVDAVKLSLDNGENYLFFVNKKDSFLWEIRLR